MALMTVPDPDRKGNAPAPKDFVQVDVVEGRPAVTSLQVAEAFGKRHSDVLRDIRVTMEKCSPDFSERNFALNSYPAELGCGLTKECPMYLLSKDGLMMVTMGYTTPEAMTVKEIFIVRFNEMEERLRGPLFSLPDFSNPALAARAWAEQYEQRQLAEAQRDEAIRTKAQIGSRREAIRLTTASACGILNFPNRTGVTVAFAMPHMATKSGFFRSCHQSTSRGVGHILARRRPGVREAPAAVRAGERRLAFFVPKTLNRTEVHYV